MHTMPILGVLVSTSCLAWLVRAWVRVRIRVRFGFGFGLSGSGSACRVRFGLGLVREVDLAEHLRWVRVFPRGRRGSGLARRSQLHAPVARADVGGALEAVGALRVAPVVHHGGLERAALPLGRRLSALLLSSALRLPRRQRRQRRDSRGLRLLAVLLAQPREEVLGRAALADLRAVPAGGAAVPAPGQG